MPDRSPGEEYLFGGVEFAAIDRSLDDLDAQFVSRNVHDGPARQPSSTFCDGSGV